VEFLILIRVKEDYFGESLKFPFYFWSEWSFIILIR